MKLKYLGLFLLVLSLMFLSISCRSAPEAPIGEPSITVIDPPTAEDPNNAQPDQVSLNNLNLASQRAQEARRLISDFNGSANFPQDWTIAEGLYDRAQRGRRTGTIREVHDSIALYDAATEAFEAMIDRAVARFFQDLEDEITIARNEALAAGAGYMASDYLLAVDYEAANAWALYHMNEYYRAKDSVTLARDMYRALTIIVEAHNLRQEIEERDFFRFDPVNISSADELVFSALDDFEARNVSSASIKANDARTRYIQSLDRAREAFASEWARAATAERERALEARANVAVRQDYEAANELFNQGHDSFPIREFDESAFLFMQSQNMFAIVTDAARERRRLAEAALREADRRLAESGELAQRAEFIIGGSIP